MGEEREEFFDFIKSGGVPEVFSVISDCITGVPYASVILNIGKSSLYIREKLFLQKLTRMIQKLKNSFDDVNDLERFQDFINKNKSNENLSLNLISVIERIDRIEKADIFAIIILNMSRDSLSVSDGLRLISMVERVYFEDLEYLRSFKNGVQRENSLIAENLMNAGFLSNGGLTGGDIDDPLSSGIVYKINIYGEKMRKIMLA